MSGESRLRVVRISTYESRKFLIVFLVVMVALIVDVEISNVADIVSKQAISFWGIVTFVAISAIYIVGQYFILEMVKAKNRDTKNKIAYSSRFNQTVTIVQYVLSAIMLFVLLQILATSHYYTNLLTAAVTVSYGLAVFLMGILTYRFISWFKLNRSLVVLLFGLAAGAITVNAIDSIIFFDVVLLSKPTIISPQSQVIFQVGFNPGTAMSVVSAVQSNSLIGYFVLMWGGTIILLRQHIQRVGRVKFWVLVSLPLIYFISYYVSLNQILNPTSPVTQAISSNLLLPVLIYTFATTACGILFGIGFWSVARSVSHSSNVRDYMIITAYGFILFLNSAQATVLQAGYPPFGLANVSFVGLSSFLILTGLYNSAISVAQDARLRQSIKNTAVEESKLLGSIGTAEMQREIENKVTVLTKNNADAIEQTGGIEPSLTEDEIKNYLNSVLAEVSKKKTP
jgi:hypothetical protein